MLEQFETEFNTCQVCPSLCQSACPVFLADGNRSHSPWGLMQIMHEAKKKNIPFDQTFGETVYHCLFCKACTSQCEHGVEVPPVIQEARIEVVKNGMAPTEIIGFIEKFHRQNNPYSKDLLKKLQTILPEDHLKRESETVYFSSCTTIAKCSDVIKDTFELFDKLKIDFVSVHQDPIQCCGYPLINAGAVDDFIDIAEVNYHTLKNKKQIVTGSPACAHTLKETYAKYDFNLKSQVVTINEFLDPFIKNINFSVRKRIKTKLMYHDPCYLSRYLDDTEKPRDMIGRVTGYQPEEFHENKKQSMCSGQSGCYSIIEKDNADHITKDRLSECYEKKIKTVVTQCPSCIYKMRKHSKRIVIKDLVSYLNDCIKGVEE